MISDKECFLKGVYTGSKIAQLPGDPMVRQKFGFRARTGGASDGWYGYLQGIGSADPIKGQQLLHSIGVADKVIINGVANYGYSGGIYFNEDGRLTEILIDATYPWTDNRDFGVFNLEDVTIRASSFPYISTSNTPALATHYPMFYSKAHADASISKKNAASALDWEREWKLNTNGYMKMSTTPFWMRYGSNSDWYAGYGYDWGTSDGFGSFENQNCNGVDKATVKFLF